MLLAPQGGYTVTDNYALNQYGEIGLAAGTQAAGAAHRRREPTARPRSGPRRTTTPPGRSRSTTARASTTWRADKDIPLPYLSPEDPVRVGCPGHLRHQWSWTTASSAWKFQPPNQLTAANADHRPAGDLPATPAPTPRSGRRQPQARQLQRAELLHRPPATDFVAGGAAALLRRPRRQPVTVNSCNRDGPRGAADEENLDRQQAKIVAAINALGADVVSLEEIENSAQFGEDRDAALSSLVDADSTPATTAGIRARLGSTAAGTTSARRAAAGAGRRGRDPHRLHLQAGRGEPVGDLAHPTRRRPSPTRASRWPRRSSP